MSFFLAKNHGRPAAGQADKLTGLGLLSVVSQTCCHLICCYAQEHPEVSEVLFWTQRRPALAIEVRSVPDLMVAQVRLMHCGQAYTAAHIEILDVAPNLPHLHESEQNLFPYNTNYTLRERLANDIRNVHLSVGCGML